MQVFLQGFRVTWAESLIIIHHYEDKVEKCVCVCVFSSSRCPSTPRSPAPPTSPAAGPPLPVMMVAFRRRPAQTGHSLNSDLPACLFISLRFRELVPKQEPTESDAQRGADSPKQNNLVMVPLWAFALYVTVAAFSHIFRGLRSK